jgi:hypothetical protein
MKKTILIFTLFLSLSIQSQNYTFSYLTGTYSNLTGATSLNNGEIWDDPEYDLVLPFQFVINGVANSNFKVYDSNIVLQTGGPIYQVIAPLGNDLIDLGDSGVNSLSPISYKIDGAVGSRIAKIEFQNCGSFDDDSLTMFVNFQIWLYEGSNIIELRYGSSFITNDNIFYGTDTGAIIGLSGSDVDDNLTNTHLLTGMASSPSLSTDNSFVNVTGTPSANTIYRFTPIALNNFENFKSSVTLFPNPFTDFITISGLKSEFEYSIYDVNGKLIQSNDSLISTNQIDTKSIASGIYILKIVSNKETIIKKIIKI